MINGYKLKKYLTFTMMGAFPMMSFSILMIYSTLLYASIITIVIFLLLFFISGLLLDHPLRQLIEGDGHLIMTNDSTGNKRLFIFKRITPVMDARIDGIEVNQAFDRNLIQYLTAPLEASTPAQLAANGDITFTITKGEYNNSVQSFNNFRVIEYNTILKSVVTKDFMKEREAAAFSEYQIFNLYIHLKNMEGFLRTVFRNLGDEFKPKNGISLAELMTKWWFWLIVIGMLGGLIYMLWPYIQNSVVKAAPSLTNVVNNNGIIQPV